MLRYINFNLWYFIRPPWDSGISPPELLKFIDDHPAGRAIDLGCGTGTNVITLARNGWQVTGIDFAPRAVQIAKRKAKKENVTASIAVGDVTRLNKVSGLFDLALDMGCFHGVKDRAAYLSVLKRILASGGYWLLYAIFESDLYPSRTGMIPADLELIQSNGFELLSRRDGKDRRERPSAWFLYKKTETKPVFS
jgi:2-polyprenyl-3-methyl-5-hydroxy-6-metoxy-1,4-benzoquinol methylase